MKRAGTSRTNKGRFGGLAGFLGENGKFRTASVNETELGRFSPRLARKRGKNWMILASKSVRMIGKGQRDMRSKADDTPPTSVASLSMVDALAGRKSGDMGRQLDSKCQASSTEQTVVSDWVKSIGEDCSKAPRDYLNRCRLPQSGE